ncbi:hypothetical protein Bbelb_395690 [Branchiostoma belcheri]|nr:hypothetical protein Bbelb_395690 [Branchiostoma belcheri]
MRCLRRILGISWQDRVPNKDVLALAGMTSMYALLSQRRLRWLGHVSRMDDGRIPKDVLYGELATGARPAGRPVLRYKDVLKRDMKAGGIDQTSWETVAADRSRWRQAQAMHEDILTHGAYSIVSRDEKDANKYRERGEREKHVER